MTNPTGRGGLPQSPPAAAPPPFPLVAAHFGCALAWLVLGGGLLVVGAPSLARGNIVDPVLLAATHCLTLGVLTGTIFGALCQFFPSNLGVSMRSVPAAWLAFATLQAGTALLVAGFLWWLPEMLGLGFVLLLVAVYAASWNLLPQRRRARQGLMVGRYVLAAHIALGTAMLLAAARIGETLGWWGTSRLDLIAAHFHLGVLGFGTLTVVGVGHRMVPMFLFAGPMPEWPMRWIMPLALVGLLAFTVGRLGALPLVAGVGAGAMAGAAALTLFLAGLWFRRRTRSRPEPGMTLVAAAVGFGALTLAQGLALWWGPPGQLRGWAAYGVLGLAGWMIPFLLGILSRIFPFLTWLNVAGPRMRAPGAGPPAARLLSRPLGWAATLLLPLGAGLLAGGALWGNGSVATVGAAAWAGGAGATALMYLGMAQTALTTGHG